MKEALPWKTDKDKNEKKNSKDFERRVPKKRNISEVLEPFIQDHQEV